MLDALIKLCPLRTNRKLAIPTGTYTVARVLGNEVVAHGTLRYVTDDGWVGVSLDGEERVDEYPAEQVLLAHLRTGRVEAYRRITRELAEEAS